MNLLILTDQFPYGHGEQFFEAELPELARHIDDITLIPIRPALDNVRLREVPSSVSVRDDLTKQIVESVQELKQQPLRALLSTQESSILLRNIVRLGLRRRGAITSFWLHAHAIKNVLKQSGLLKDGTVMYSYWLMQGAYAAAMLKRKYPHLKAVARAHRYDVYSEYQSLKSLPFQREMICWLDAVYVCNHVGRQYLVSKFPDLESKLKMRYLGAALQSQMSTSSADRVLRLISCSSVIERKRLHLITDALHNVKRRVHWTHIGDGPLLSEIKNAAKSLPDHIKVNFLGKIPHEDVISHFKKKPVDLFVNVSESEGLSVSLIEAMSFGVPCISTDVGGMREAVNDRNGYLLEKDFDIKALTEIIQNHESASPAMRQAARDTQREKFSAQKNYSAFAEKLMQPVSVC